MYKTVKEENMARVILDLSYGQKEAINLRKTWIQPKTMSPGYMLCYEDDIYSRGIIYRSMDKQYLMEIQDKLMDELDRGKRLIKLP